MVQKSHFPSGELASLAGVSPDTLRHYERMKLLAAPRRSSGNYRLYPPEALDRVRLIRRAMGIGFSLGELSEILKVRDGGGAPCRRVKRLLDEKLSRLDEQISDLLAMRDHLSAVSRDWDGRLSKTPNGKPAGLLDSLTSQASVAEPSIRKEGKYDKRSACAFIDAEPCVAQQQASHSDLREHRFELEKGDD